MKRQWTLGMIPFLVFLLIAGCSSQSATKNPPGSSTQSGGTLVVGSDFGPDSLDPAMNVAWASTTFYEQIYEGLLRWNAKNEIVPSLATSYEATDGGKIYTFKLRQGVKFHNGREMTADDVKFCFDRILDPKTGSPNQKVYEPLAKVEVVDPYTVRFTLKQPFAPFLSYLATPNYGAIYPKEAVATLATTPVGTGPFMWSEFVKDQQVKMIKNPNYWDKGLPKVDTLIFKLIPDDAAQVAAIRSKSVDMTWLKDPKVASNLTKTTKGLTAAPAQTTRYMDIKFKLDQPPFNDVRVRRAFSLAIDRQAVVDTVLGGFGSVGTFIPAPPFAHPAPTTLPYYTPDLAKAKQLLQEAGATNLTVDWKIVAVNSLDVQMAQVVKEQLDKVGVKVNIKPMEVGAILKDWATGNYQMVSVGTVWVPDPDLDIFARFYSQAPAAKGQGLNDKELDDLFLKARSATTIDERKALYVKVQERLSDQAYNINVYDYPLRWEMTWDYVKGYQPMSSNSRLYLREVSVDKK
jgi:peptide/nickel transport system substrate-binding protein